ncbi:hypothetical protein [Gulosibacter chungangensis]|uniref:Uncharacterized protein n=1 Tax=Gulosibacter chungangensis TaxID=979746 RepID=A0A7J5B9R5_9MICO|nr:hypothetical protein [Gulosibacter chungangensis]KAB1640692.1 hypothetical protein F8O05_14330 [Gulosibacter chungangensis]
MIAREKIPESAAGKKIRNGSGLFLIAIFLATFGSTMSSFSRTSQPYAPGISAILLAGSILLGVGAILFIIGCFYLLAGIATYFDQRLLIDAKLLEASGITNPGSGRSLPMNAKDPGPDADTV